MATLLMAAPPSKMIHRYLRMLPPSPSTSKTTRTALHLLKPPPRCVPLHQALPEQVESGILCEPCNGKGWLLCDFCNGQKINVKADNKRIYRRCPSCRAVGYVLCSKCKVFKCVTFPNHNDGEELSF